MYFWIGFLFFGRLKKHTKPYRNHTISSDTLAEASCITISDSESIQKHIRWQNFQKINYLTVEFVYKLMLTKYEHLTPIQLRETLCTKLATPLQYRPISGWKENSKVNTFFMIFIEKLSKDPGIFRYFRNVSNFEELYLRAQWIFFDGTGTVGKIYV